MLDRSVSHEGSVSADTDSLAYNRAPVGSAMVIDRLQSLLKQKEGELANAQVYACAHTHTHTALVCECSCSVHFPAIYSSELSSYFGAFQVNHG